MVKVVVSAGSEDTSPANFIFPHLLLSLALTSASSSTPNHHLPPLAPPPSPPLPPSLTPIAANIVPSPQPFSLLSLLDGSDSNGSDLPSLLQPIFISCLPSPLTFSPSSPLLTTTTSPTLPSPSSKSPAPPYPLHSPCLLPLLIRILSRKRRPHEATYFLHTLKHLDCTSDVFAYNSLVIAFARVAAVVGECTTRQMGFSWR